MRAAQSHIKSFKTSDMIDHIKTSQNKKNWDAEIDFVKKNTNLYTHKLL